MVTKINSNQGNMLKSLREKLVTRGLVCRDDLLQTEIATGLKLVPEDINISRFSVTPTAFGVDKVLESIKQYDLDNFEDNVVTITDAVDLIYDIKTVLLGLTITLGNIKASLVDIMPNYESILSEKVYIGNKLSTVSMIPINVIFTEHSKVVNDLIPNIAIRVNLDKTLAKLKYGIDKEPTDVVMLDGDIITINVAAYKFLVYLANLKLDSDTNPFYIINQATPNLVGDIVTVGDICTIIQNKDLIREYIEYFIRALDKYDNIIANSGIDFSVYNKLKHFQAVITDYIILDAFKN